MNENDPRLTNQKSYLFNVTLKYSRFMPSLDRDHEHCVFCWIKIPDEVDGGYCTIDENYWICDRCFNDFKEIFQWKVQDN